MQQAEAKRLDQAAKAEDKKVVKLEKEEAAAKAKAQAAKLKLENEAKKMKR